MYQVKTITLRIAMMVGLVGTLFVIGCGGDDSGSAPVVKDPAVSCESVDNMGYEVVDQVSVTVTDPDGDLKIPGDGLKGQFDGFDIRLKDPNADTKFTWSPPEQMNGQPQACFGSFSLKVTARDAKDNVTNFSASVSAGGNGQ